MDSDDSTLHQSCFHDFLCEAFHAKTHHLRTFEHFLVVLSLWCRIYRRPHFYLIFLLSVSATPKSASLVRKWIPRFFFVLFLHFFLFDRFHYFSILSLFLLRKIFFFRLGADFIRRPDWTRPNPAANRTTTRAIRFPRYERHRIFFSFSLFILVGRFFTGPNPQKTILVAAA